jgi:N-acetylglutamate synthase-like GNAT family acetyltransferase
MHIRHATPADHKPIIQVIDEWWGGRPMADMLPKLVFIHFQPTSFVIEEGGERIAFLIGFVSQTHPNEAYIHFVGIHPDHRKRGLGRMLYEKFFETVRQKGCDTVRCVTSIVNKTSIAFHTKMGFAIEEGDAVIDGVPVFTDYDGLGGTRVLFVKKLSSGTFERLRVY